ncbi:MAG: DNA polymerase III subunit tau [Microgenomates bacterium OLB22]|nr:MAG: DNA polymerase III subunit tau [Microgenomates bacterium OLB22]
MFYQTFRPLTIAELDNEVVKERLKSILTNPPIAHAFLLTGPKGTGKTTSARLLAKALNCQNPDTTKGYPEPCTTCDHCQAIQKGTSPDIFEIDGASHRKIETIREIIEQIHFPPLSCQYKVYIIDEVHMLTTEAFNALLKTLEEPPAHAIFILATTEFDKVPATIRSRCTLITVPAAKPEDIRRMINRISNHTKTSLSEEVQKEIITFSDSSFRDATKLVEEMSTVDSDKKTVSQLMGGDANTEDLLQLLIKKDRIALQDKIEALVNRGANFTVILEQLLTKAHTRLKEKTAGAETREHLKLIKLLQQAYKEQRFTPIPSLPLELVFIEYCLS